MASSNSSMRFSNDAVEDIRWQEDLGVLEDDDGTTPMLPFAEGNTPKSKCLRMHNHVEPISSSYPVRKECLGDGWATTNDQILQATKESNKLMQTLVKKIEKLEYMVVKHMQACDKKTEMP
ncbi:hypothetical protein CFC21_043383 [Triticum aestivum]|uniref:Uncharacterized protein n=1 Tax=Triticum aestivum TaxID=4565 RepID=A0A9R1FNW7_WHEAT|nr:hypothetical protein CFC21_043383 [Triticum aestivum]